VAQVPETVLQAPETPFIGCEAVEAEIAKYSGWDVTTMTAIAIAENRTCDSLNHNLTMSENHKVCVGSYGVLQVGCLHYEQGENRDDLATNVAVAHRVWLKQGYNAWTMYNNGTYKEFIK
jgi:hypothetical protein